MLNQKNINFSFVKPSVFKSILSLYFFTLGTCLLGFSVYLMFEAFDYANFSITNWSGESLFWAFILFFASLFLLFFPIEFLNTYKLMNKSFTELISNVSFTIVISLFFLILFQALLPANSLIFLEIGDLFKATSFAGFIFVPITLFVLNYLGIKYYLFSTYGYSLVLFIWIMGSLIFV